MTTPLLTEFLICPYCETVHRRATLGRWHSACCVECGATIARNQRLDFNERLALTLAAAILFAMANLAPVLSVEFDGLQTHANVWSAVLSMQQSWMLWAGLVLAVTTFFVPMLQIGLLLWLLSFNAIKRPVPGLVRALGALQRLRPWSMCEVFLLGSLIVLVKLSNWVHIAPGPGMWALAAFTVLLAILSECDSASWWTLAEQRDS